MKKQLSVLLVGVPEHLGDLCRDSGRVAVVHDLNSLAGAIELVRGAKEHGKFDLIVTAEHLADGSGMDLIREAKKVDPEASIVGLTTDPVMRELMEEGGCASVGTYDFIRELVAKQLRTLSRKK
ncbi:MAG: hypothetical protein V4481_03295 [Patescibacteria group bacterium]